jgi:DNA repair exonuclease SbcCD nuclease subunit
MARIAFIADVHLGNHRLHGGRAVAGLNMRARLAVDSLTRACKRAKHEQCDTLVVCGDLFDSTRPEPQLVRAAADALCTFLDTDNPNGEVTGEVHVLAGNHDLASSDPGDHALGPIGLSQNVWVHQAPCSVFPEHDLGEHDLELLLVPYRAGRTAEWLPGVVAQMSRKGNGKHRMLALHAGILDEKTAHFLAGAHDSIEAAALTGLMLEHGIAFAAAGNWHDHRAWHDERGTAIVQCGALVPTGWDNPGLDGYGSLIVYDTGTRAWERIEVAGPRFITVSGDLAREQYRDASDRVEPGRLFVRWKAPARLVGQCASTLIQDAVLYGGLAGAEAVPDAADREAAANAAAQAARVDAPGLDETVRAYVEQMTGLADNIDRAAVLEHVRRYLAG